MGLVYPEDLEGWSKWQANAHPIRRAKVAIKEVPAGVRNHRELSNLSTSVSGYLHTVGKTPQTLIALDSTSPTSLGSLVRPAHFLSAESYAVWAPEDVTAHLSEGEWAVTRLDEVELYNKLVSLRQVLALGHYMAWGGAAYRLAQRMGARFITVQHGLHTPYAPPLAPGTHLLAFSQADAEFWISGRGDVTYDVVGSQLLWESAQTPRIDDSEIADLPIFLGQMHGAELSRLSYAQAGYRFCKETGARYRPHPNEKDKLSVLTHALWDKVGIEIDRGREPLNTLTNPVVSIFSTGVLEAAIRGFPAWVYHPNPPAWVREFWDRYGLSRWGEAPTPAPAVPSRPPAQTIAQYLEEKLK
ncbi:RNA-binding protein [Rothia nasimurium]|uniref:RNA-binding protein n=1 Tax=Rothia nasimurium TaxID=85336 RepID=A0A4Y9F883_9MICC|nr:RNA-binding protein [Rothia nasimurium]